MKSRRQFLGEVGAVGAVAASAPFVLAGQSAAQGATITVALFGDYGSESPGERAVADLVAGWNPAAILTLGDNVYSGPNADPYEVLERKAARFYQDSIDRGIFYPSLGNHDWGDPGRPLLWSDGNGGTTGAWHDLFHPPGNGRYYDVRIGDLHVFVLNDYYREPDGNLRGSRQAEWLRTSAAASDAAWKIVTHHYPAYVSPGGGFAGIRWPFADWGIDASYAGHWHHYERVERDGMLYICSGLGGASISGFGTPIADSKKVFNGRHGSVRLRVSPTTFVSEFVDIDGVVRDSRTLTKGVPTTTTTTTTAPPTTIAPTVTTILPTTTSTTSTTSTSATAAPVTTPRPSTTQAPTTQAPKTRPPTTQAPTTKPPTTQPVTTPKPTTTRPATTAAPTTALPTTAVPLPADRSTSQTERPAGAESLTRTHLAARGREATMVRLYLATFRRAPDDVGLAYWTDSEFHLIDIADVFVSSPEFNLLYQNVSDEAFVQILYGNVLGREPDEEGQRYWLELLAEDVQRGLILLGFSDSVEFAQRSGVVG